MTFTQPPSTETAKDEHDEMMSQESAEATDVTTEGTTDAEVAELMEDTVKPCPQPKKQPRKKREGDVNDRDLLEAITKCGKIKEHDDDLEYFAKSMGETMRRFDKRQQGLVKMKIQQLLFDIEWGHNVSMANDTQPQPVPFPTDLHTTNSVATQEPTPKPQGICSVGDYAVYKKIKNCVRGLRRNGNNSASM